MMSAQSGSHRVITLAGHVDHGKSTLLRALTGMEPDRLPEERLRGRTIELGYLWAEIDEGTRVSFVDVPGHARLVGTMIAGSGVSPAGLLVIAADDGPSVQTREHLDILDLLGVPGVAIALTKADRVDGSRLAEVEGEIGDLVAETTFSSAPVVPVAAPSGVGIRMLKGALCRGLAAIDPPAGDRSARLWVDRAFTVDGAGTVVTGTLADGTLRLGDHVGVLPGGHQARVRRIQQLGEDVDHAQPGTRVAANLAGVDVARVRRGDVLVAGEHPSVTVSLDAWVRMLPDEEIARRQPVRLHCGTAARSGAAQVLGEDASGGVDRPDGLTVRIRLDQSLHVRVGDRLILREPGRGRTIGGGIVIDPLVPRRIDARRLHSRARSVRAAADLLRASRDVTSMQSAWLMVEPHVRSREEIVTWTGAAPREVARGEPGERGLVAIGSAVASGAALAKFLAMFAGAAERQESVRSVLATLVDSGLSLEMATAVLEHGQGSGVIDVVDATVLLPGSRDNVAADALRRAEQLVARFEAAALDPPSLTDVAEELDIGHLERQRLVSTGALVRIGDLTLAGVTVDRAVEVLRSLQEASGPFTASQARIALGTTRRVAIPLLEHLGRMGRARFDGRHHQVIDRPRLGPRGR